MQAFFGVLDTGALSSCLIRTSETKIRGFRYRDSGY